MREDRFKRAKEHFGPFMIGRELTKAGEIAYYYNFQWRTGGYILGGPEHEGVDYPISLEYKARRPNNLTVENYKEHTLVCSDCLDRKLDDEFTLVGKVESYEYCDSESDILKFNRDDYSSSFYQCDACSKERDSKMSNVQAIFGAWKFAVDRPDLSYEEFFEMNKYSGHPLPNKEFHKELKSNAIRHRRENAYCRHCEKIIWLPTLVWLDDKKQFSRFFVCDKCDPSLANNDSLEMIVADVDALPERLEKRNDD